MGFGYFGFAFVCFLLLQVDVFGVAFGFLIFVFCGCLVCGDFWVCDVLVVLGHVVFGGLAVPAGRTVFGGFCSSGFWILTVT